MKNIFFLIISICLSIQVFAQESWTKIVVDKQLSVSIPGNIEKMDTLGQKLFYGITEDETKIIVSKLEIKNELRADTAELGKYYRDYMAGMLAESQDHEITGSKKSKIDNLQSFEFGFKSTEDGAIGYTEVVVVFTKEATYSFIILGSNALDIKKAKAKLLQTVKFNFKEGIKAQIK